MKVDLKKPEVSLFSFTPEPEKVIGLAVSAWHARSDELIQDIDKFPPELADKFSTAGLRVFHKTALEYVNLVFVIKNVSRAFQQQLTRTRHASFSIQSMRVQSKTCFAKAGQYTMPPGLSEEKQNEFHIAMLDISDDYFKMIDEGYKTEDARGILPLNIHSDITMCINLNALYHMLGQRFCVLSQNEYREVATQMKQLVKEKLGSKFSDVMNAPCVNANKCVARSDYCGTKVWKLPQEERDDFYLEYIPEKNPQKYGYAK